MLSTIGYEGARSRDFIMTLKAVGIEVVVDVRDRAQSRRPGFSKTALETALASNGIAYMHHKSLGDPKAGRDAARAGQIDKFHAIFEAVLESAEARDSINTIIQLCKERSVCLLCYERDPSHCHRTLVANRIEALAGIKARRLGVRTFEQAAE